MNSKRKVTISWSGGKDSAFALYKILTAQEHEVVSLHTVIDEETKRVGLHGVKENLIDHQAAMLGLPLQKIYLPRAKYDDVYQALMDRYYAQAAKQGIEGVVFGDIFLEDLRTYRLNLLRPFNLFAEFPLWKINSSVIVDDFINVGFKSAICSADAKLFAKNDLGRDIDHQFLKSLSSEIDPCGENGEFHSFVYDGPIFKKSIPLYKGEVVKKSYAYQKKDDDGVIVKEESEFWFQDFDLSS